MDFSNKIIQGLGIPYSALLSIIFGMMIISFPIGMFLVFNSGIGGDINYEYPITGFDFFLAGINYQLPLEFQIGDAFIVLWGIFVVIFAISIFGPEKNFARSLVPIISDGKKPENANSIHIMIKWFSILIIVSGVINIVQEEFGIITEPPIVDNRLIQFFEVTKAPLTEEIGFRMLLIGVPLFAMYSHRTNIKHFFKSLWNPFKNLDVVDSRKAIILIVIVAIFFGLAHIISGESWSSGKFAQASASGIIIGWVYFRYGFAPALLIHWATNYFVFSYVFLVAQANNIAIQDAFSHSLVSTLELLFVLAGIVSIAMLGISYYFSKKEKELQI